MKNAISALKRKANQYQELKKQRGVTLLEIIIVLGIIGIIAAGVVVLAQRAFFTQDISDLADSANTIHVSTVDGFGKDGGYPAGGEAALGFADETALKTDASGDILATLYKMGKISNSEARNSISGDYFVIQGVPTVADATDLKGFVLSVNGLDMEQCRALLGQVAGDWEYVEVTTAASGAAPTLPTSLDVETAAIPAAGTILPLNTVGVLKSLAVSTNRDLNSADYAMACADSSTNAINLGSR